MPPSFAWRVCLLRAALPADGGEDLGEAEQASVDRLLSQLEEAGARQQPRPLDNPLLMGNCRVGYVSTRQAPKQDGKRAPPVSCKHAPLVSSNSQIQCAALACFLVH
jgi:hypothetical protein